MRNRYQINYRNPKNKLIYLDVIEALDLEDALHTYFKNFKNQALKVTPVIVKRRWPGLRVDQPRPGQEYWEVFKL